jgi:survival-of-motor-neuron-related-splicing factor 30
MDPENAELSEMYNGLEEVIALTRDLLQDAKQQHDAAGGVGAGPSGSGAAETTDAAAADAQASTSGAGALGSSQIPMPAELSTGLPGSVADQIKRAQQRSALTGQAPAGWAAGAECLAYYAADGQWYPAKVESVTEGGGFVVTYEGYGTTEEVG